MDYPGKDIFVVTVARNHKTKHVWLVVAESHEDAAEKFAKLATHEREEGEPILFPGDELSYETLEFERGVSQMW